MNRTVNKVILVGTVGGDPDIEGTRDGDKEARFSLPTQRRGAEKEIDWHHLVLRKSLAQFGVCKGDRIYVEGRLEYNPYEMAEIIVERIVLLKTNQAEEGG